MPAPHNFEHLPLLLRFRGPARLPRGGKSSPQTLANKKARQAHSTCLHQAAQSLTSTWQERQLQRGTQGLPVIPHGVSILLQVDPHLELDALREKFDFEIVAEQEDGYVIVAAEDIELGPFVKMVGEFAVEIHGSATIAQVHKLFEDPNQIDRLRRILSERLFDQWPSIDDATIHVVDIGIACTGTQEIPARPKRGKRDTDADWAIKESAWSQERVAAYTAWDKVKADREEEMTRLAEAYRAEMLSVIDGGPYNAAVLPDSFTVRLRIVGKGLKDLVLNYPYIFEVVEPEDFAAPHDEARAVGKPVPAARPTPPAADAPAVCVIDSGIQEGHTLLQPAVDQATSHCFLPGRNSDEVGDFFRPAGHGTRVAGAVLYGENVPRGGAPQLPFWIQNARVLDEGNRMPEELFPPAAVRAAVERFHRGPRQTRIFNHSINAEGYCRTRHMSSWAAEIDALCAAYDVLIVQSAGNLGASGTNPFIGLREHLAAGREYPGYLYENSCRIANPAQSLQALTVGSVAYGALETGGWRTFASEPGHPSAFSRSGFGIWDVIKPEVVEYGGDATRDGNAPPGIQVGGAIRDACPELVRSTMFAPGPAFDRDQCGTSFATPKVSRIAAQLQSILPNEPALLYRALIVQSARWPIWADALLVELRSLDPRRDEVRRQALLEQVSQVVRCLGYGVPDPLRASTNGEHRTTLITSGDSSIRALGCHIYQVPVPAALRQQADEFDIRIEVTLSYVAQPRRTRRKLRRYLSTWLDWTTSKLDEPLDVFRRRALKGDDNDADNSPGSPIPWALHAKASDGLIRGTKRSSGTVQKDWAVVKSNTLPENFCIAVMGHKGWSHDPDSTARYTLAVTFEIEGKEIAIYEPLRAAVQELQATLEVEQETEVDISE